MMSLKFHQCLLPPVMFDNVKKNKLPFISFNETIKTDIKFEKGHISENKKNHEALSYLI